MNELELKREDWGKNDISGLKLGRETFYLLLTSEGVDAA